MMSPKMYKTIGSTELDCENSQLVEILLTPKKKCRDAVIC